MKIYAISFSYKNGFELLSDEVYCLYYNSESFVMKQGDVLSIKQLHKKMDFDHLSVDSFMFCYLDKKSHNKALKVFKKVMLQAIDSEINDLINWKEKIKLQTLKIGEA